MVHRSISTCKRGVAQQPKKRGQGRPPKAKEVMLTPIPVRFPAQMVEAIEAIQAERVDQPDKSAIIRELVAEALQARAKKKGGQ